MMLYSEFQTLFYAGWPMLSKKDPLIQQKITIENLYYIIIIFAGEFVLQAVVLIP